MRNLSRIVPVGLMLTLASGAAFAAADLVLRPRVFNDAPNAQLYMSASGSTASVSETNVSAPREGGANRDDFLVSEAGGAPTGFDTTDAFTFFTDVTLTGDPLSPRKEAGIRINNPITGDALFIINSDGHEVVAFGGGAPFWNAVGAGANPYNVGETITLGVSYRQQGGLNGIQYTVIQNGNTYTSGFNAWQNNEQGIGLGSTLGTYFQIGNDQNNPDNSGGAVFTNMRFGRSPTSLELINATPYAIPEPGSMALLGTGLLTLVGLRRRK